MRPGAGTGWLDAGRRVRRRALLGDRAVLARRAAAQCDPQAALTHVATTPPSQPAQPLALKAAQVDRCDPSTRRAGFSSVSLGLCGCGARRDKLARDRHITSTNRGSYAIRASAQTAVEGVRQLFGRVVLVRVGSGRSSPAAIHPFGLIDNYPLLLLAVLGGYGGSYPVTEYR